MIPTYTSTPLSSQGRKCNGPIIGVGQAEMKLDALYLIGLTSGRRVALPQYPFQACRELNLGTRVAEEKII